MTPEEAYAEALRRIREAEETGAVALDLSRLELNRLPRELGRLTSLRSLDLSGCEQLSDDLSPWHVSPRSNRSTSPGASSSAAIFPR
jgi:hypothetical protein